MSAHLKFDDKLGQHMTPSHVASLLCQQLPKEVALAVDLAVGDGALLAPLKGRRPAVDVLGVDCDPVRVAQARAVLGDAAVERGNGLTFELPQFSGSGRLAIVGNPPFLPIEPTAGVDRLLRAAFPGVESSVGRWRMEMGFLARALVEARRHGGLVAMVLPSSFSAGLRFAPYRAALLRETRVVKAIEIRGATFRDTEAKTTFVLLDTLGTPSSTLTVESLNASQGSISRVYCGSVTPGERWDAGYWYAKRLRTPGVPTLRDVGVDVTRGRRSHAEAARVRQRLLHTTDLARVGGLQITLPAVCGDSGDIFAEVGDYLLPRTGTRVRWVPIRVANGRAPISDHVLRIRAPQGYRRAIGQSFRHEKFSAWLGSISKGVCATVLSKNELLDMPLFSLE